MQRWPTPWHVLQQRTPLLVVAFALTWGPATASGAECGDHVYLGKPAPGLLDQPREPLSIPPACPLCSRNDAPPLMPAGSAQRIVPRHDVHSPSPVAGNTVPESIDKSAVEPLAIPSVYPSIIYRPPR